MIPQDRRRDPAADVSKSERAWITTPRLQNLSNVLGKRSDAGTGATDGAFAEPDEIEEIRRFSEDENFSYETCLTARSHPSDVKEL